MAHLKIFSIFTILTFQCEWHRHYTIYKPLALEGLIIKFYIEEI